MYKLDLEKAEEPEIKLPTSAGLLRKKESSRKYIYFCFSFIDYTKAFDCVDHNKLWKIFKEMGVPDHLTCLPRNQHVDQEATIKTRHETTAWIKTGKGVQQGCLLSPCSLNIYRMHVCMLSCFNKVQLFATIWAVACQASLSMGFSRQEYWSGLPCPPPGDLPTQGLNLLVLVSCIGRRVLYY